MQTAATIFLLQSTAMPDALSPTQTAASAPYGYKYWLATQYQLFIAYAGDHVASAYVSMDTQTHVDITNSSSLEAVLSYSATWQEVSPFVYRSQAA